VHFSVLKCLTLYFLFKSVGNDYLITDMKRARSIFEAYPVLKDITIQQINKDGSNLSFVKSNCIWKTHEFVDEASNKFETFRNFQNLDLFIDLKTAQLLPTIIK
jgi:hypothetical protein